jgi:exosortase A
MTATARLPALPAPALAPVVVFTLATAASVLLMLPAWSSMAAIWWHNETYTHGMLVPLASAWLAWRERDRLAGLTPRACPAALVPLAACALAALLGQLAGVESLRHFAAVGAVMALFVLCFGPAISRALVFPLGFLLFAVPFGDFMMPWLMDRTADFTVGALQLSGVPVLRDGRQFVLPSGNWSVVEACSGLRYLLAAVPVALLQVHLNRRTLRQRLLFIATVIAITLAANWVRAYGIVMLGHVSDMRLAAGVDHLVYGWVFFGVVMAIVFWVEGRMPTTPASSSANPTGGPSHAHRAPRSSRASATPAPGSRPATRRLAALVLVAVAMLAAAPLAARALQSLGSPRIDLARLQSRLPADPAHAPAYRPGYHAPRTAAGGAVPGDPATAWAAFGYRAQHAGAEMIAHGQGVVPSGDSEPPWQLVRSASATAPALPGSAAGGEVNEHELARAGQRWLVWEWFWIDGKALADPRRVKIATAAALLAGRGDESVAFVVWTPLHDTATPARARLAAAASALAQAAPAAGFGQ